MLQACTQLSKVPGFEENLTLHITPWAKGAAQVGDGVPNLQAACLQAAMAGLKPLASKASSLQIWPGFWVDGLQTAFGASLQRLRLSSATEGCANAASWTPGARFWTALVDKQPSLQHLKVPWYVSSFGIASTAALCFACAQLPHPLEVTFESVSLDDDAAEELVKAADTVCCMMCITLTSKWMWSGEVSVAWAVGWMGRACDSFHMAAAICFLM